MNRNGLRIALISVDAFACVSAIAGWQGMVTGGIKLPLYLLRGTPFTDYIVPAWILGIAVGGSALVAVAALLIRRDLGALASMAAGCIMAGWITVEVALIGLGTWMQPFYFIVGMLMIGLAALLWIRDAWNHVVEPGRVI